LGVRTRNRLKAGREGAALSGRGRQ
jgi:hypothetical protein